MNVLLLLLLRLCATLILRRGSTCSTYAFSTMNSHYGDTRRAQTHWSTCCRSRSRNTFHLSTSSLSDDTNLSQGFKRNRNSNVRENRLKLLSTTFSDDIGVSDSDRPSSRPSDEETVSNFGGSNAAAGVNIWTARGILLVVAMIWGTNFASVKYMETLCFAPNCAEHMASEAALARFGVAALIGLPFLINKSKEVIQAGLECGALT